MTKKTGMRLLAAAGAMLAGVVCAADELVVSSDTVLNADTACSAIRFTGGYTLAAADGVKVTVEAGGGITVAGGSATVSCPVQFGPTTDGGTIDASEAPVAVASGATLTFSAAACLSGDAKIVLGHPGTVDMYATNTFNGTLLVTNGFFNVYSDGAFGTTRGGTTYDCRLFAGNKEAYKMRMSFYGVTMADDFTADCADVYKVCYFYSHNGVKTNAFIGKVTATSNFRWVVAADTTLLFGGTGHTNTLTGCNCIGYGSSTTSHVVFNVPTTFGHWYSSNGPSHFNAPLSIAPYRGLYSYADAFYTGARDVFSLDGKRIYLNIADGDGMKLDLQGNDQVFEFIKEKTAYTKSVITSERPATLRLLGVANASEKSGLAGTTYSGRFTGAVNLQVEGAKPFLLTGQNTSEGTLCVTNGGQLAFSSVAVWAGDDVRVFGTGSKLCATNLNVFSEGVNVSVGDGGTLELSASGEYVFNSLAINGTVLADGTYPAGSAAFAGCVTGLGSARVQKKVAFVDWTWNGAQGENLFEEGNWVEDGTPDFADSSARLTFAAAGARAVFGGGPRARQIAFDAADGFTLATNAAGSSLTIYSGGVTVADAAAARAYRLDTPVVLTQAQTWNVGAKCTLSVNGPLETATPLTVTKTGTGTLALTEPSSYAGNFSHEAGKLVLPGGALGGAGNKLIVFAGAKVDYAGGTYAHDIKYEKMSAENDFQATAQTTNVFTGTLDLSKENVGFYLRQGSKTTLGPFSQVGYQCCYTLYGEAELVFAKATTFNNNVFSSNGSKTNIVRFCEPGFVINGYYALSLDDRVRLVCDADWAFHANTNKTWRALSLHGAAVFDLNGHDQGIGGFSLWRYTVRQSSELGAITSETPATLYDYQLLGVCKKTWNRASDADDDPFGTRFTGQVSLSKSGPANLFLSGVSPTSGRLEVTEGTLGFKEGGSWPNASEVAVLGGTLAVDAAGRLPPRIPVLRIGQDATLNIADGVSLRCEELYVQKDDGTWIMTAGHFKEGGLGGRLTGGGTLQTKCGFSLVVR